MEAEDTVMCDELIKVWCLEFVQPGELDLNKKLKEFARAQAEMTWRIREPEVIAARKAGIKEMMEFCKENQMPDEPSSEPYPGLVIISKERMQAKLKEWIKEDENSEEQRKV